MTAADTPPAVLAALVATAPRPLLVGLDVDGVLSPLVPHPDQSALLPGILDTLVGLAASTDVAVVSGRSVADLTRFAFPAGITVLGTHGLERRGADPVVLTPEEQAVFGRLSALSEQAARRAGTGAWVEVKDAALVLHVREADPRSGESAVTWLTERVNGTPGVSMKLAKSVVELFPRATSKATAMVALRDEHDAASVVFVGDDVPDEEVFATLADRDIGVKVGAGPTLAGHRLADPDAVLTFLRTLSTALR